MKKASFTFVLCIALDDITDVDIVFTLFVDKEGMKSSGIDDTVVVNISLVDFRYFWTFNDRLVELCKFVKVEKLLLSQLKLTVSIVTNSD